MSHRYWPCHIGLVPSVLVELVCTGRVGLYWLVCIGRVGLYWSSCSVSAKVVTHDSGRFCPINTVLLTVI